MQDYTLKISKSIPIKDLTIIYKDSSQNLHEIKASMDDILKSLRYFQKKSKEISQMHIIYVEENISFELFQCFISSITSNEIKINDSNYEKLYYLSCKYEYEELRKEIENFINTRPDICSLFNQISEKENSQLQFDEQKEELIAKNLDISIKTGFLRKIPLEILNRILNSPYRKIKDHHLLFSFVISTMKNYSMNEKIDEKTEDNLSILSSSLDYCEMTNEEIEEFFKLDHISQIFGPRKANERMKMFISEEKEMKKKISMLEEKIDQNKHFFDEKIKYLEEKISLNENNQKEIVEKFEKKNDQIQKDYNDVINENIEKRIIQLDEFFKGSIEKIMSAQNGFNSRNDEINEEIKKIKIELSKINQLIQEEHLKSEIESLINKNNQKINEKKAAENKTKSIIDIKYENDELN